MTTITKKQILLSLQLADEADKKYSSGCEQCWIHHLIRMVGFESIRNPCSNIKKILMSSIIQNLNSILVHVKITFVLETKYLLFLKGRLKYNV